MTIKASSDDIRWAVAWSRGVPVERVIVWSELRPLVFLTRREAKEWIESNYGYMRVRKDLYMAPHYWRMPSPVKIRIRMDEL